MGLSGRHLAVVAVAAALAGATSTADAEPTAPNNDSRRLLKKSMLSPLVVHTVECTHS